jgi:hypothetical protein
LAGLTNIWLENDEDTILDCCTDETINILSESCHNLSVIHITSCTNQVTENAINKLLISNPNIKEFYLELSLDNNAPFSPAFWKSLTFDYPKLSRLDLVSVCKIDLNILADSLSKKHNIWEWIALETFSNFQFIETKFRFEINKFDEKFVKFCGNFISSEMNTFFELVSNFYQIKFISVLNLTDKSLKFIAHSSPALFHLSICGCGGTFSIQGIANIFTKCTQLDEFSFTQCDQFTLQQLVELFKTPNTITKLYLSKRRNEFPSTGMLVSILKSNSQIKTLTAYGYGVVENAEVREYLKQSGRELTIKL